MYKVCIALLSMFLGTGCASGERLLHLTDRSTRSEPSDADYLRPTVEVGQDADEDKVVCSSIADGASLPRATYARCMDVRRDTRAALTRKADAERARTAKREETERRARDQAARERAEQEDEARRLAQQAAERTADEERARAEEQRAAQDAAQQRAADAKWEREERARQAKAHAKIDELKARCGDDYRNVRVGMRFDRVVECTGSFRLVDEGEGYQTYEGSGGWVVVQGGVVRRVTRR